MAGISGLKTKPRKVLLFVSLYQNPKPILIIRKKLPMTQTFNQLTCPNCNNPIQAHIQQLVDVGQDPAAKAKILSGSLNLIQCNICGYQGQITSPLVYHDPEKELLLTYIPVEMGIPKDQQEQIIGQLINQAIQGLEPEERKGYLFQPQSVLTMQSLSERILEADGITKEEIEAQREKLRLFEQLLKTPEENLPQFVQDHDDELDSAFFQLATLSLQATGDQKAQEAANQRIQKALELTSFGKELMAKEAEFRIAAESIQQLGESVTHESLLELFIQAPNEERVNALIQLTRPALDYTFFQKLTERIDQAQDTEKEELTSLRGQILEITQEIDKRQEARAAEAAGLLKTLVEADDLDEAITQALPMVDELFLSILQANIRAAQERGDQEGEKLLLEIDRRLRKIIHDSLPAGLQLAQQILEMEDLEEIQSTLENSSEQIDQDMLGALMSTAQRLEASGNMEEAERIRDIYRRALRISMKSKVKKSE
jgi:hypothetical protein